MLKEIRKIKNGTMLVNYLIYQCDLCGAIIEEAWPHCNKDYPELRTDVNNGITLCEKCHKEEHCKRRD